MPLMRHPDLGTLLRAGSGLLAYDPACCCIENGCCPNQLIKGTTVLLAELLVDTTGCFTVGETMCLDDGIGTGIWTSQGCHGAGFFDVACWKGLSITCGANNFLTMIWDSSGSCPLQDNSPGGNWGWNLLSAVCDPFEFIYDYNINEDVGFFPGCNCDCSTSIPGTVVGNVKVKITISP